MYWQLQISSQPVRNMHILPGNPSQISVSVVREIIEFYGLETGAKYGELTVDMDVLDQDEFELRREEISNLKATNDQPLPFVDLNDSHLYILKDGQRRVIHDLNAGITLEDAKKSQPLSIPRNKAVVLVDIDREQGAIAALTQDNMCYVFQQGKQIGRFSLKERNVLHLFLADGDTRLIVIDPQQVQLIDAKGKVIQSHHLHFTVGPAALSPNGTWLVIADADHQLIRLYNKDLMPIRQQHAIDLLSRARPVQLFVNTPPASAPLVAIDITEKGELCFAMAGVICTGHIDMMTELPQQRLQF